MLRCGERNLLTPLYYRNMFLAAAVYFHKRFEEEKWIADTFQSAIITVSTVTNLVVMFVLTHMHQTASYPFRINLALIINTVTFSMLAASTVFLEDASPAVYLVFVLAMVGLTAYATGLIQNGAFAFAASFGRSEYMQALMVGQGVAGVLPPIVQIVSVLSVPGANTAGENETTPPPPPVPEDAGSGSGTSAFIYFLTAVAVSLAALLAFIPLARRHHRLVANRIADQMAESLASIEEAERSARKVTGPIKLFLKLPWLSSAIIICFSTTMFFPVFTAKILSVRGEGDGVPAIFQPAAFVPFAFFMWNLGDLSGRVSTALPFSLRHRPFLLFLISLARIFILPLYLLCNVGGRGAVVQSDFFYLFGVQVVFGLTNGWLGSSCMMAAGEWVEEGEREAAGGFMGLCLVLGLALGSLLSFSVAGL